MINISFVRIMFCVLVSALLGTLSWPRAFEAPAKAADVPVVPAKHGKEMAQGLALFKSNVRGTLVAHCVKCHGRDKVRGGLNMASREGLIKGGDNGPVVVIGKPRESRLYKLITHQIDPHMPDKAAKLPDRAIADIAKWIELGAPFDKPLVDPSNQASADTMVISDDDRNFWSFKPLQPGPLPRVKNGAWVRNGIDHYVLARLEGKNLSPNAAANRRQLIRRAYLDLVGLPPTPAEVDAFVNDKSADAWEKVIDELLASPHYGERWGRHWLDVARFGESHGFEQDYNRPHAYHYRDFVIKALNSDMPYDKFIKWQLAGDEFAPDNALAMMATGFIGAGVFPTQLTEKEFESARYDELDDIANTMGTGMLGLTIGCARCHDHKYDPIATADYYRLIAAFATTIRSEIDLDLSSPGDSKQLAEWENQRKPLAEALETYEKQQFPKVFEQWLAQKAAAKKQDQPAGWMHMAFAETKSHGGATFKNLGDGSYLATGKNPANDKWTFVFKTDLKGMTAVRLEVLAHPSMKRGGPGRAGNGNFALSDFRVTAKPAKGSASPVAVKLINAKADFQQNTSSLSVASSIDNDPVSGWAVDPQFGKDHAAVFEFAAPVGFEGGTVLTIDFHFNNNTYHSIGRPRLSITTAPPPHDLKGSGPPSHIAAVLKLVEQGQAPKLSAKQRNDLMAWYKPRDVKWSALNQSLQSHLAKKPKVKLTKVMVTSEGFKPMKHHADGRGFPHFYKDVYQLKRGDPNQKMHKVSQGFLQVLMRNGQKETHWQTPKPTAARTSFRRTALANWITDVDNGPGHLLARVMANRLWLHHFGQGIVTTPNDFGYQGTPPTHPRLLDYLAAELIGRKWSLKSMHKLIMTSAAYTQSNTFDDSDAKVDPQNQLLWRYSPRRLEAEVIRDSMLAISGQLDRRMYGPGTLDEGHKRRSIYFMIKRSKLIRTMQLFDMPEPLVSQGERPATTIAPQALHFMNSPQVRSYATTFGSQLKPAFAKSPGEAVRLGYRMAYGREPLADELKDNAAFLAEQIASYQEAKRGNAIDLALADFAQVLMSLNEFVYSP